MTDVMPEKIDLTTTRLSDEKLAQLRQLIPEAFSDGSIDFDALRRSLGDAVDTSPKEERFGLRWPGKSKLQQVINQPSVGTLVPQPEESVDWDTTQNLIIEGDNLEVLKLLQKSYAGQVKMIYIDPPYNTGNEFIYPDNFREGLQTYLEYSGQAKNGVRQSTDGEALAAQLQLYAEHRRPDRSAPDVLYELLLKSGRSLTAPIVERDIAGGTVYDVDGGQLLICLEDPITESALRGIIEAQPERVLCLDAAFAGNDQLKTNIVLQMRDAEIEFRTV